MDNLKDVILQTLEELEDNTTTCTTTSASDEIFLKKLREKILVLFEGLQSPNIVDVEKKLDLTINFLEYTLAEIDKKLSK